MTYKDETLAIHAGYSPEATTKAVAVPIYQTTSYAFDNTQHGADLFDLKVQGNIYTRIMNPTTAVLEQRLAALEGGIGALALAQVWQRSPIRFKRLLKQVTILHLYPLYTVVLITYLRIHCRNKGLKFVSLIIRIPKLYVLLLMIRPNWSLLNRFNPLGNIIDLEAISKIAHEYGVPVIVDNTVATPALLKPFEFGADIVVHSLTKYIGGHGNSIGGVIIDSGKFPWGKYPERFKALNTPDPSYHGVNYVEVLGEAAYIARARVVPLRNTGLRLVPECIFDLTRLRNFKPSYGAPYGECSESCKLFETTSKSKMGQLCRFMTIHSIIWHKSM
jgi:O-acetylhomoserine (thiol)-lyase